MFPFPPEDSRDTPDGWVVTSSDGFMVGGDGRLTWWEWTRDDDGEWFGGWGVGGDPDGFPGIIGVEEEKAPQVGPVKATFPTCDVYWGSHGCHLPRSHKGGHFCCCECPDGTHPWGIPDEPDVKCVGKPPYYGWRTWFYGDDAPRFQPVKWLLLTDDFFRVRWARLKWRVTAKGKTNVP